MARSAPFLLIFWFVAMHKTEASTNLTLVRKGSDVWCVAQGEDAFTGLSWISTDDTDYYATEFKLSAHRDCDIMKGDCENWKGWTMQNSLDFPMPEVLDYRWNDLALVRANKRDTLFNNNNNNRIKISNKNFTLSIFGKTDAYIYLCKDWLCKDYYWIILGGWSNTGNLIRTCQNKDTCTEIHGRVWMPIFKDNWIHVTVTSDRTSGISVYYEDYRILHYADPLFSISHLDVARFNDPVYFRYHNYSYFWSNGEDKDILESNYYTPRINPICWSIVYSIKSVSGKGYLEVELQYKDRSHASLTKKLDYYQHQWKHKKVYFTLDAAIDVKLTIRGKEGEEYAVGGIIECNPEGDTSQSMVRIDKPEINLSCQSLQNPNEKVQLKSPGRVEDCGADCTVNCKMFDISSINDCSQTVICKNSLKSSDMCFCSSGYKPTSNNYYNKQYCSERCSNSYYGINCGQKCGNCNSSTCDQENGECHNGCTNGYNMPLCKTPLPYLKNPPSSCSATMTSIEVTIDNFEYLGEGNPEHFLLQYKESSDKEWKHDKKTYEYNVKGKYKIENLKHGIKYDIRGMLIDVNNKYYSGNYIPYINCITTCDHPSKENVKIETFTNRIKVNWKVTNTKYPCQSDMYIFILLKGQSVIYNDKVKDMPFQVQNLMPFTNYAWILYYNNDSLYSGEIKTKEGVPSAVESLEVSDVSQTAVTVTWQEPKFPNGNIKFYEVTCDHKYYISCEDDQHPPVKQEKVTNKYLRLENLEPYSHYVISVRAYTVGFGDPSVYEVDTLGYGVLKVQPEFANENPVILEKNTAQVCWSKPQKCSSIQGAVIGYRLTITGRSDLVKTCHQEIETTHNCHKFQNLKAFSNYTVSIVMVGNEGPSDPQYALLKDFRTKPDVPHIVGEAKPYSYGASWIYLKWREPSPPTGDIEYYAIRIGSYEKKIDRNSVCELWDGMICGKIEDGLTENQIYHIQILAKNKEIRSLSLSPYLTVTTQEKAPGAPENVKAIALTSSKVNVTWQHPNETNGKLTKFKLHITLKFSGLKNQPQYETSKIEDVPYDMKNYFSEIDNLPSASKYSVEILGVTVADGTAAQTTVETFVAAPKLGTHLALKVDSITDTSFEVFLPAADASLTKNSSYIVIVTSEDRTKEHPTGFVFLDEAIKRKLLAEAKVEDDKYSWVAAEVQPKLEKQTFTIGDNKENKSQGLYVKSAFNRALVLGERYQVTLLALNRWGDKTSISSVKLEKTILSGYGPQDSGSVGIVAAWVILVLLLITIPFVIFFIIKRRKLIKDLEQLELKREDVLSGNSQSNAMVPDVESEMMSDGSVSAPSQRFSQRIHIDNLEQYVKSGLASGELERQHALFPRGQTRPWKYGLYPENKSKNRYGKLAAYDDTRVILKKLPDDPFSDYINANYIDGYNSTKFYIATQGPKRNTVVDFWRMIWQENVQVIAMLANVFEDGKVKCEKYWPDLGQEFTQGAVVILNASERIFADFTFRILNVSSKGKSRKVHHLHFTSWPDHSVPMYPQSVACYLKKLLAIPPGDGPIVVHCSAGVGRTGTIILSDICLRMAAAERCVDILGFLQKIREQRANLVDNLDQYKLVHLVLLECLVIEPSSYPCDVNFEHRVQELINTGTVKGQYSRLSDMRWQDQALKDTTKRNNSSSAQMDPAKNRNLNIVPESHCRVYISSLSFDDPNSDYINAVYVDGFRIKDQFIVTQFPLEPTVPDFWRLIAEKKIPLVVVLNDIDDGNKSMCNFWPSKVKESIEPMPHMKVTKKLVDDATFWRTHTLSLSDSETSRQVVRILHLKGWRSDNKIPPSEEIMIQLWEETEKLYSGKQPIVVCCLNGATACGYFVALAFLIEKIKLEQQCDVCQAVRTVRQSRKQFVPNYEQFESLYKSALIYLHSFQTYSNFG